MKPEDFLTLMKYCNSQKVIAKSDYLNEMIDIETFQYVNEKLNEIKNKIEDEYLEKRESTNNIQNIVDLIEAFK